MISQQFFSLTSKNVLSNFLANSDCLEKKEPKVWEHLKLIKGEYTGFNFPIIFKQEMGKKLNDIVDTGWVALYLISDRMKKLLEENQLKGWKDFPIKLFDKQNNEIMGYHGFSIIGKCDPLDYSKSEIIEKQMVPTGPLVKFYRGMSIDNWDGSDFFCPTDSLWSFVGQRAAKILTKNKITNLRLTDITGIEVDTYKIPRTL